MRWRDIAAFLVQAGSVSLCFFAVCWLLGATIGAVLPAFDTMATVRAAALELVAEGELDAAEVDALAVQSAWQFLLQTLREPAQAVGLTAALATIVIGVSWLLSAAQAYDRRAEEEPSNRS